MQNNKWLKEGNGLKPYLYHEDMENLIICYEREEDQIKCYVFNCRKVAIEDMQFNNLGE